jgi:hypothetical protein
VDTPGRLRTDKLLLLLYFLFYSFGFCTVCSPAPEGNSRTLAKYTLVPVSIITVTSLGYFVLPCLHFCHIPGPTYDGCFDIVDITISCLLKHFSPLEESLVNSS